MRHIYGCEWYADQKIKKNDFSEVNLGMQDADWRNKANTN